MLDFSSAERSCFRVSSTPLTSPVFRAASRLSITGSRPSAKRSRAYLLGGGGLGLGALAGVLGVGHGAQHGVALLLDLGLGFGE